MTDNPQNSTRTDTDRLSAERRTRDDRGELAMSEENMRLLEILVLSADVRAKVTDILEADDLDYVVADGGDDDSATVSAPIPAESVEHVQRRLEGLDIHDELYTVVVDTEAVVSDRFETEAKYTTVSGLGYQGVSRSELHATATNLMPDLTIYTLLTAISAIVAAAGVLLNSLPVLVGSMVIAPLIGPIMAASVATIISDDAMAERSWKYQLVGLSVAGVSSILFSVLIRFTSLVAPGITATELLQLSSHTAPNLLLVVVALAAGFAGALSISTGGGIDLVGVMISAAIMPPIGVMGVAVAWGQPGVVVGSLAVVLVNLASVSLAAIVSLWYLGYHPESLQELRKARSTVMARVVGLVVIILSVSVVLAHVSGTGLPSPLGVLV